MDQVLMLPGNIGRDFQMFKVLGSDHLQELVQKPYVVRLALSVLTLSVSFLRPEKLSLAMCHPGLDAAFAPTPIAPKDLNSSGRLCLLHF